MFHVKWLKQVLYIYFYLTTLGLKTSLSAVSFLLWHPTAITSTGSPLHVTLIDLSSTDRLPWLCGGWVAQIRLTLWPSDRCFPYLYANLWDSLSCLASSIAAWQLLASSAPWDRNACSSHVATSMPLVRLYSCRANRGRDTMGLRCCCTVSNFQQSTSIQTSPPRSVISEFSV